MLVFGDSVLRLHHLRRGCREFKSGLASIVKITSFIPADQERVNAAQVVELVWQTSKTVQDLSIAVEWFVKTVPNIAQVHLGYSSVCAWWVLRYVIEVYKN